jgi:hypothetical protein
VPFEVLDVRLSGINIAVPKAASTLSQVHGATVSAREIERGLVDVLGLDQIYDLLYLDIDCNVIVNLLRDYDFAGSRPESLCEVTFDESILPPDSPVALREAKVKMRGEIWVANRYDRDPFPSNPHAHNYDRDLKIHLGTGDIYEGHKRVPCRRMKRRDLIELRSRFVQKNASIELPLLVV